MMFRIKGVKCPPHLGKDVFERFCGLAKRLRKTISNSLNRSWGNVGKNHNMWDFFFSFSFLGGEVFEPNHPRDLHSQGERRYPQIFWKAQGQSPLGARATKGRAWRRKKGQNRDLVAGRTRQDLPGEGAQHLPVCNSI